MIRYILIVLLILIVLGLLIHLYIVKKNIRELTKELSKTKDKDYNREVRVTLADRDVEYLASEINCALEYQKKLKMDNEKSRRQLEQSVSDIAHDLRTPLTVVKGNLQMLEKEPLSDKGREYLRISSIKSDKLKEMVDEFFELSVLESDDRTVDLERLELISFLSDYIIENETLIRQHELTPEITFPDRTIYVKASREMLSRVLGNIISNIFKYAKGSFTLEVISDIEKAHENECIIRIGNEVKSPESIDLEHIFDRTYRADKARSEGSAGLGLYIAKLLMEKQGGDITADIKGDQLIFDIHYK